MKFAFCLFKYYPYGGLERNFIRITQACQQRGHSIDIYTMAWHGDIPQNLYVTLVPCKGQTNHHRCKTFVNSLMKMLAEKHYDAIVGFNRMPGLDVYYAADICYEQDVRQRHGFLYRLGKRYKVYSEFERAVFSPDAKTQIMLLSEVEKQYFIKYYHTPLDRFHLLPPGIAKQYIAPPNAKQIRDRIRTEHQISDQQFLIISVGSDYKRKGLGRTLLAIASLPQDIRERTLLWVVGKGKSFWYKLKTKMLGISKQVNFLGIRDDVPNLLLASDLLLHPAYQENTGNVLLEAIVAGVPVLATDACGFAFHIKQANAGLVIPSPFKQSSLNSLLKEVLTSGQYSQWKKNALNYSKTQDLYSRINCAVEVIERVASEKQVGLK